MVVEIKRLKHGSRILNLLKAGKNLHKGVEIEPSMKLVLASWESSTRPSFNRKGILDDERSINTIPLRFEVRTIEGDGGIFNTRLRVFIPNNEMERLKKILTEYVKGCEEKDFHFEPFISSAYSFGFNAGVEFAKFIKGSLRAINNDAIELNLQNVKIESKERI